MPSLNRRSFLALTAQFALGAAGLATGCSSAPTPVVPTATSQTSAASPTAAATQRATSVAQATLTAATPAAPAAGQATAAPAATAGAAPAASPTVVATATGETIPNLAVVHGSSPAAITKAAVAALGGIGTFVKPGQKVLIKPNICSSRAPEYAATTNPEVVATLVSLCREAGAARVLVVDNPFSGMNTAYRVSGIESAVKTAGGEIETMSRLKYRKTDIPQGKDLKSWSIYEDALTFDVLINVPIAKNHDLATLTLSMKNLLGVVDNPGAFHSNIGQRLADLGTVVRPRLVLVDAVRILTRNGPTGGDLRDVKATNTVIATVDPVAADAYAATLFGMRGDDLAYVRAGAQMGLGERDLSKLRIGEISL